MSWSDAIRVETEFLETQPMHRNCEDGPPLGELPRARDGQRAFSWIRALARVEADDVRKIQRCRLLDDLARRDAGGLIVS